MKTNHRITLVERLDSRRGILVDISELEERDYDLQIEGRYTLRIDGRNIDVTYFTITQGDLNLQKLERVLNLYGDRGKAYICPSPEVLTGVA